MGATCQRRPLFSLPFTRSHGTWLPKKCEPEYQFKCARNHHWNQNLWSTAHQNTHYKAHSSPTNLCPWRSHGGWRTRHLLRCQRRGIGFLVCWSLKVDSTPAILANMYSTQKNSMTISLTVNMWHRTTKLEALLDCGATHNFIDPRTIKTLAMGTNLLKRPLLVHNVDGTINQGGTITSYCNLWVRRGTQVEKLGFYVTNLGRDRLILGYPWFKKFNPKFNWSNNTLEGDTVEIDTAGYWTKIVADDFGYVCLDKGKRELVNVVDDSKHNAETSHMQRPKQ